MYKAIYNYNLEECNQLFKVGVLPIGCGRNNKTGNVFLVFSPRPRYYDGLKIARERLAKLEKKEDADRENKSPKMGGNPQNVGRVQNN